MLIVSSTMMITCGFLACGTGPIPSSPGKKPTVYVKSNTLEKFKNLTKENAVWNGISPFFVENKQYMRCDMTDESIAVFAREGFEVVSSSENADYTFEVTLISCGGAFLAYQDNRSELALKERALYKDLMEWINETDSKELPKDAKEIAKLISQNDSRGFKRFFDENYIVKYGKKFNYTENWHYIFINTYNYMKSTGGVVLPNKYYGITDEDKAVLEKLYKHYEESDLVKTDSYIPGLNLIGSGARLSTNPKNGYLGSIGIGIGLLGVLRGITTPTPINKFKIINNRTGKSWSKVTQFSIRNLTWDDNIDKPLYDWTIDEISWGDLE